jgi:flavin reductase (DIM6/NTAB) family NADH-FMN oxidoreductase RutF
VNLHFAREDLDALQRERRVALVNSLTGLKGACLVGTCDGAGRSNLAIFSSALHVGASPPLLGLLFRPDTVERHTLENLRATDTCTLNHVREDFLAAAHQTSARYPRQVSEFAATGLREEWWPGFAAPFVAEAAVRIGLLLREEQRLAVNGTIFVVGEIVHVDLPGEALTESGSLDPSLSGSIAVAGLDSYYASRLLRRLPYARAEHDTGAEPGEAWVSPSTG